MHCFNGLHHGNFAVVTASPVIACHFLWLDPAQQHEVNVEEHHPGPIQCNGVLTGGLKLVVGSLNHVIHGEEAFPLACEFELTRE